MAKTENRFRSCKRSKITRLQSTSTFQIYGKDIKQSILDADVSTLENSNFDMRPKSREYSSKYRDLSALSNQHKFDSTLKPMIRVDMGKKKRKHKVIKLN